MVKRIGGALMYNHKSWLKKMSTTGIEVEGVESPAAGLSKIVVGEVLSCEDVPETHLHVCQVNVGEEEARQIVLWCPKCACWYQGYGGSSRSSHR